MDNFHYALTTEQLQFYENEGYLIIRGFFSSPESQQLQQWAQEVHDLPRTGDVPYMPYEVNLQKLVKVNRHNMLTDTGNQLGRKKSSLSHGELRQYQRGLQ